MKKILFLMVVAVLASSLILAAGLSEKEKADILKKMTLVEDKTVALSPADEYSLIYFKNCTFEGLALLVSFNSCMFDNCTFNIEFTKARFVYCFIDGGTITNLKFKSSNLDDSNNVVEDYMDEKSKKKDKGQPWFNKHFTDHIATKPDKH